MNISEYIKQKIYENVGLSKLPSSPNDDRLTFINNDELIRLYNIREYKVWYNGDASEMLNFYTTQQIFGYAPNLTYNRNNINMFWSKSSQECQIKRIHVGFSKAIIDTLCDIVGKPTIQGDLRLNKIYEVNDFGYRLQNEIRNTALVEGDCCVKLNINPNLSDVPLMEVYGAADWEPIVKSGILLGLIFKTYYKDEDDKNYILFETRSLVKDGCLIDYDLFEIDKQNNLYSTPLDKIPELSTLKPQLIKVRRLFARPLIYYRNSLYPNRGKSFYDGIIDQLDFLDEIWSQASQTNRVSTPVEYYNPDVLERTSKGKVILPELYNRQFVQGPGQTDSDGISTNKGIETTQPDLNFEKYASLAQDVKLDILVGRLSPSSFGMDISKKDNAEAQREKEKQSIYTRGTIIDRETTFIKNISEDALLLQDYMETSLIQDKKYEISIKYDEFANPSFESELQVLGPAWSQGQITTEDFVRLLWSGKKSEEEIQQTITWLDENKQKDDIDMEGLLNETGNSTNLPTKGSEQGEFAKDKE